MEKVILLIAEIIGFVFISAGGIYLFLLFLAQISDKIIYYLGLQKFLMEFALWKRNQQTND